MSRAFSHSLSCISLCVRLAYSLGDGQVKAMFETTTDEALQFHDERMEMMKLLMINHCTCSTRFHLQ
eukprot:COSAG04_NODE_2112_length_4765_cov_32.368838_1_plen_67_part_00